MRVVIAPDSFKGTLTARQVAEQIAAGWREARPHDELVLRPMADGGEGTLEAIESAVAGAVRVPVMAVGPGDEPVLAHWLRLPPTDDAPHGTGVVELASTSGITLMRALRPFHAHSFGFGQAIRSALDQGVSALLLAVGGTASTDAGAGALTAMGARLTDARGVPVPRGNLGLPLIARLGLGTVPPVPPGGAIVLTDVTAPLLGPHGAAAVFGPQKGADPDAVRALERNLAAFAALLPGIDPETPGAGAAGGAAFGLMAWGARLASGAAAVAEAIGLPAAIAGAELVITGEGRFDASSLAGKVPGHVIELAAGYRVPAALIAGSIAQEPAGFRASAALIVDEADADSAAAPRPVRVAAAELASRWTA